MHCGSHFKIIFFNFIKAGLQNLHEKEMCTIACLAWKTASEGIIFSTGDPPQKAVWMGLFLLNSYGGGGLLLWKRDLVFCCELYYPLVQKSELCTTFFWHLPTQAFLSCWGINFFLYQKPMFTTLFQTCFQRNKNKLVYRPSWIFFEAKLWTQATEGLSKKSSHGTFIPFLYIADISSIQLQFCHYLACMQHKPLL